MLYIDFALCLHLLNYQSVSELHLIMFLKLYN